MDEGQQWTREGEEEPPHLAVLVVDSEGHAGRR